MFSQIRGAPCDETSNARPFDKSKNNAKLFKWDIDTPEFVPEIGIKMLFCLHKTIRKIVNVLLHSVKLDLLFYDIFLCLRTNNTDAKKLYPAKLIFNISPNTVKYCSHSTFSILFFPENILHQCY